MTVSDNKVIQVRNLMNHQVTYLIEEDNIRRSFNPFETKNIKAGELRKAIFNHGTEVLFKNYLCVEDKELAAEFGISEDTIEYWWTEDDIKNLLLKGSDDELLDALDFAPDGIVEMIVFYAIDLKINDMNRRTLIERSLGYPEGKLTSAIDLAMQFEQAEEEENPAEVKPVQRRRRAAQNTEEKATGRRVQK